MADYDTEVDVIFTPDERSLRQLREQLESAVGDVTVGMTDGGSISRQMGGGGGGRQRRRARREHRWARSRTEDLSDLLAEVRGLDVGGDGGGGLLANLFDVGGELAGVGAQGVATGVGAAAGSAVGTAAGQMGGGVLDRLLPGGGSDGETPPSVEGPDEIPVEEPTLDVEPVDDIGVDVPGEPLAVEEPVLGVEDPSPLGVESVDALPVDREPLPVERDPLPVEGPVSVGVVALSRSGLAANPKQMIRSYRFQNGLVVVSIS